MELIRRDDLFKCETCFHSQHGPCDTFCDALESYRPAANKLKSIDPVHAAGGVYCWECRFHDKEFKCCNRLSVMGTIVKDTDFCSFGKPKAEINHSIEV